MNIELYYVRGIDNINTPYFTTINQQLRYFASREVAEIIDTYYPPHYRDTIKLTKDDVDFNTPFNYLSIEFNNKRYYYFVNSINYISEECFSIDIEMDTIQTYMFDIEWNNATVSRLLINRWGAHETINREYLRENFSTGNFNQKEYKDLDVNENGIIVIETTENIEYQGIYHNKSVTIFKNNDIQYSTGNHYYLLPSFALSRDIDMVAVRDYATQGHPIVSPVNVSDYMDYFRLLCEKHSTKITRVYSIPVSSIEGFNFTETTYNNKKLLVFEVDSAYHDVEEVAIELNNITGTLCYGYKAKSLFIGQASDSYFDYGDYEFTRNTLHQKDFDFRYCPQLLDENYIQAYYGERIRQTSFPMHLLETPKLYLTYNYDISTGSRVYNILDDYSYLKDYKDAYRTTIVINTQELVPTYTDAWNEYISRNLGSATIGLATNIATSMFTLGGSSFSGYASNLTNAISNVSSTGTNTNWSQFGDAINTWAQTYSGSTGSRSTTSNTNSSTASNRSGINTGWSATGGIGAVGGFVANAMNLMFTPDTQKQGNQFTTDIIANSLHRITYLNVVEDIEDIAYMYESIGYKVHIIYNDKNLFDASQTRYYYGYIQCEDLNINLNVINDNITINNIKSRFISGLRLYPVDTTFASTETRLPLGQVCVYDNVEL